MFVIELYSTFKIYVKLTYTNLPLKKIQPKLKEVGLVFLKLSQSYQTVFSNRIKLNMGQI